MRGTESLQLLTNTQLRHLKLAGGASDAVDLTGFMSVVFVASVATPGAVKLEVESSPDGVGDWSAVVPAYFTSEAFPTPVAGDPALGLAVFGTTTKSDQFVAVSLHHQGREAGLDAGINPFVRVKVTGAVDSVTAMLSQASWKPVEQPDMEIRETKGTI